MHDQSSSMAMNSVYIFTSVNKHFNRHINFTDINHLEAILTIGTLLLELAQNYIPYMSYIVDFQSRTLSKQVYYILPIRFVNAFVHVLNS